MQGWVSSPKTGILKSFLYLLRSEIETSLMGYDGSCSHSLCKAGRQIQEPAVCWIESSLELGQRSHEFERSRASDVYRSMLFQDLM